MSDWQPIETVPKDRYVLLYTPDEPDWAGNKEVGKWFGGDDGGFWSCGGPNSGLELESNWTHWAELPPSPPRRSCNQETK